MKSVIAGRRYDTDKAILIGKGESATPYTTDFSYWSAGLYKTPRKGEYFLAGEGHAMTAFARADGDGRSLGYGRKIIPMSREEAREWAEHELTAAEYEAEFGDITEDA